MLNAQARQDVIDIVVPSKRGFTAVKKLLTAASDDAHNWGHHHFIVVFDEAEERNKLRAWLSEMIDVRTLPHVTHCIAKPGSQRNLNALRQQGLNQGMQPYVYFQDDDDPLPTGLDRRLKMIDDSGWDAVYGVTQTVDNRGNVIETFPTLMNGAFAFDPHDAMTLFPTYFHPLAALFKRELLKALPLDDGKRYNNTGSASYAVKLMHLGRNITFLSDTIRTVRHHGTNDTGIMSRHQAEYFAHDIMQWLDDIPEGDTKEFHKMIGRELLNGTLTTFREISALVESELEF